MSIEDREERGAELFKRMIGDEKAGEVRDAWNEICPDFENYVIGFLAGEVWSRDGLDLRTKSLTTISALAALGRPRALDLNIRMALNNGATKQDITETLLQIAPYAGFPATWEALAAAHEVFKES